MSRKYDTTMIGSLPHQEGGAALQLLDRYPLTIPAWPQLPKRSFLEGMIPQYTEGLPGIRTDEQSKTVWLRRDEGLLNEMAACYEQIVAQNIDAFAMSDKYAAGLIAFLNQRRPGTKLPAVKGQVTGPFTFGLGLNDSDKKAVWFDEQYRDIIIKGLGLKGVWQVQKLRSIAEQVYIFFDEPILSALGTPAYIGIQDEDVINGLNEVYKAAQKAGARVGTHCCGNMDWGLLARTEVDIIAFDAYFYGEKVALYPEEINAFLKRGGVLAWGIVPTNDPGLLKKETPGTLQQKIDRYLQHFINKGISENLLTTQMMLTPSCGMGLLSPDEAKTVLELLSSLAG